MDLDAMILQQNAPEFFVNRLCKLYCARRVSPGALILMSKANVKVHIICTFSSRQALVLRHRTNGIRCPISGKLVDVRVFQFCRFEALKQPIRDIRIGLRFVELLKVQDKFQMV